MVPIPDFVKNVTEESIRLDVERGIDVNEIDDAANLIDCDRWTRLHYACRYNFNAQLIRFLIENGADVKAANQGWTPLHVACRYKCGKATIEKLIKAGSDLEAVTDGHGLTPLHVAAACRNLPAVKALIKAGANIEATTVLPDSKYFGCSGWTPLHLACGKKRPVSIVRFLIEAGANIHAKGHRGLEPLHMAEDSANSHAIEALKEAIDTMKRETKHVR